MITCTVNNIYFLTVAFLSADDFRRFVLVYPPWEKTVESSNCSFRNTIACWYAHYFAFTVMCTYSFYVLLLVLVAGILSFDSSESEVVPSQAERSDYHLGCVLVILASAISGLSGSLSQVALTSLNTPRHTAVFTIELAVYGMVFLFARLAFGGDEVRYYAAFYFLCLPLNFRVYCVKTVALLDKGFFNGWTIYTMIPVFSNVIFSRVPF